MLEPGGALSLIGKKPAPEELRHHELLRRLDQVIEELAYLRMLRNPPPA